MNIFLSTQCNALCPYQTGAYAAVRVGASASAAKSRKQWQVAIEPNPNLGPARTAVPSHCSRAMQVSLRCAERGLRVGRVVWT